jgi:hypothetical protein
MDFFIGLDALQNYFSEILGIAITVLILPCIVQLYIKKRNRPLTYMFLDRVFSYSKHLIKKNIPTKYIEDFEFERYTDKNKVFSIFQSFRLNGLDEDSIELHYIEKLGKLRNSDLMKYLGDVKRDFEELESEINSWLTIYSSVMSDDISRLTHKLLYELRSFKHKYGEYLDLDNECLVSNYADYVTSITFELIRIYDHVLEQYPIEEGQV